MIKDYLRRCFSTVGSKIHHNRWKLFYENTHRISSSRMLWKTVGAIIVISSVIGIVTTIWFGRQIKTSLDDIGKNNNIRDRLTNRNEQLVAQRDMLIIPKKIERAANKLGLYAPSANQIRKP